MKHVEPGIPLMQSTRTSKPYQGMAGLSQLKSVTGQSAWLQWLGSQPGQPPM
jgi:hypothetical protein